MQRREFCFNLFSIVAFQTKIMYQTKDFANKQDLFHQVFMTANAQSFRIFRGIPERNLSNFKLIYWLLDIYLAVITLKSYSFRMPNSSGFWNLFVNYWFQCYNNKINQQVSESISLHAELLAITGSTTLWYFNMLSKLEPPCLPAVADVWRNHNG